MKFFITFLSFSVCILFHVSCDILGSKDVLVGDKEHSVDLILASNLVNLKLIKPPPEFALKANDVQRTFDTVPLLMNGTIIELRFRNKVIELESNEIHNGIVSTKYFGEIGIVMIDMKYPFLKLTSKQLMELLK